MWGRYAEFEIRLQDDNTLLLLSDVDGVSDVKEYKHDFISEIKELEDWYYKTELPPKLEKKHEGCTFAGRPSCPYYYECWGD